MGCKLANHIFYHATLSTYPGDYEIIGGPSYIIPLYWEAEARLKEFKLVELTENEAAYLLSKRACIGSGVFVGCPDNPIVNEERRLRSNDLSIYIAARVGVSVLHEPIMLDRDIECKGDFKDRIIWNSKEIHS